MHYCTACDWVTTSDGEDDGDDSNEQAIQHYLETDHSVVQRPLDGRPDRSHSMRNWRRL